MSTRPLEALSLGALEVGTMPGTQVLDRTTGAEEPPLRAHASQWRDEI